MSDGVDVWDLVLKERYDLVNGLGKIDARDKLETIILGKLSLLQSERPIGGPGDACKRGGRGVGPGLVENGPSRDARGSKNQGVGHDEY